ncbi:MAG: universal stress protein [Fimbriimonadaceae bacterium]|nr:universal stress protein [Fimbriimonadaceae bacterium]QYK57693.1 MAG: universal stress protein [Fimbriimonadaceae bacterium]
MKVLLGVDLGDTSLLAEDALFRLGVGAPVVEAAHVVEPLFPDAGSPNLGPSPVLLEVLENLKKQGEAKLEEARARLEGRAASVETNMLYGFAVQVLSERALAGEFDLVAVGSERKGAFGSLFLGSVTRGLALESRVGVLIGKSAIPHDGPMKVLLATDGSEYFDRCLEKLMTWKPAGLGEVTVLSAYSGRGEEPRMRAHATVEATASRWHSAVGPCTKLTREGHAVKVIGEVMRETAADLLVIGAQGTGFLERLFVGSVAMHQVVNEPWNLMLLRA